MSNDILFTLFYILFVLCTVYPPSECVSAGFTIPTLFSSILGNEHFQFIEFHIKRTCLTLFIYSLLPLLYLLGLYYLVNEDNNESNLIYLFLSANTLLSKIYFTITAILPILAVVQIISYGSDWENHQIAKNLKKFCNNNSNWRNIASDINNEFRRIDKICIQTSSICRVIATENWIIKILPLHIYIAHQSDSTLEVKQSDTHNLSHLNVSGSQFLTIEVQSARVDSFKIRLNALEFQDLQDRIARVITVNPDVKFHKSLYEKFSDAFKDAVKENEPYTHDRELEKCIGCMQNVSNVKLQKLCDDATSNQCTTCYCKPMWCIDCLAKWFAHRQDMSEIDSWLSKKCTCPTCRATFCLLDVCYVKQNE